MMMRHFRPLATSIFLIIVLTIQVIAQITPPLGLDFGDTRAEVTAVMESRPGTTLFSDKAGTITYLGGTFFEEPVYLFLFMFNSDSQLWATSVVWKTATWGPLYRTVCAKVSTKYTEATMEDRTGYPDEVVGKEWNNGSTKILVYVDTKNRNVHLMHIDTALMNGKKAESGGGSTGAQEDDI